MSYQVEIAITQRQNGGDRGEEEREEEITTCIPGQFGFRFIGRGNYWGDYKPMLDS